MRRDARPGHSGSKDGVVKFVVVYIREVHPAPAQPPKGKPNWTAEANDKDGVHVSQPKTEEERNQVASTCSAKLALTIPFVVDGMDNKVEAAYAGWPDRLYNFLEQSQWKDGVHAHRFSSEKAGRSDFRFLHVTSISAPGWSPERGVSSITCT